jgi:hypothetical protein
MDRDSEQKQLEVLMDWVTQHIKHEGRLPQLSDVPSKVLDIAI